MKVEKMKNKIITKGKMFFRLETDGLEECIYELDDLLKDVLCSNDEELNKQIRDDYTERYLTFDAYDYMDGKEFLDYVRSGGITDYDGTLGEIVVDGYISNLGLAEKGLMQGEFLVSGNVFEEICEDHEVKVNWANK